MKDYRTLKRELKRENDQRDLKSLSDRLTQSGFSWRHADYLLLRRCLPELLANKLSDATIGDALFWVENGLDNVDMSSAEWQRTKRCKEELENF